MPPLSGSIRVWLLMWPIPEVAFVESALIVEGGRAPVAVLTHIGQKQLNFRCFRQGTWSRPRFIVTPENVVCENNVIGHPHRI